MFDRKANKEMKALLTDFVGYVEAQAGQEYDAEYDEEEETPAEESKTEEKEEETPA